MHVTVLTFFPCRNDLRHLRLGQADFQKCRADKSQQGHWEMHLPNTFFRRGKSKRSNTWLLGDGSRLRAQFWHPISKILPPTGRTARLKVTYTEEQQHKMHTHRQVRSIRQQMFQKQLFSSWQQLHDSFEDFSYKVVIPLSEQSRIKPRLLFSCSFQRLQDLKSITRFAGKLAACSKKQFPSIPSPAVSFPFEFSIRKPPQTLASGGQQ